MFSFRVPGQVPDARDCLRSYLFIPLLEQCRGSPMGIVRGWKSTCSSDYDRVSSLSRLLLSIFDSVSLFLSFCSSSYHAHPFHDYTPFSVATFHFDFPKFPARCQMLSYWIVRTFFSLAPFFLRGSSFARFLSLRKLASTAR